MSIYSGFATRSQEQTYDQLVFNLVQVLSRKILKNYTSEQTDQSKFTQIVKQIFMKLSLMEKQKYLQPNLSNALYDIMEYFIQKEKLENNKLLTRTPNFWVKIQKKSDQNFTNDTHKQPQVKPESRQTSSRQPTSHVQSRLKTPIINPEFNDTERRREKHEQYAIPLKNKFNKQINSNSKDKQKTKKHQSLRRFQQNQLNETMYKQEQVPKKVICPHCHEQTVCRKSPKPVLRRNQRSQSLKKRQNNSSKILVPQLVKEYIDSTNHLYMKHFRKRKVRNGPEFY